MGRGRKSTPNPVRPVGRLTRGWPTGRAPAGNNGGGRIGIVGRRLRATSQRFLAHMKATPARRLPIDGPRSRPGAIANPQQEPESAVSTQPDHYATLHVSPDATAREITRAYRTLLRTHHPDTRQKVDDGDTTSVADLQELHAIMQAYVVLSDPGKRAAYDRSRRTPGGTGGTPVKVRFHRSDPTPPQHEQSPLSFGPARWEPPPIRPRRSNS